MLSIADMQLPEGPTAFTVDRDDSVVEGRDSRRTSAIVIWRRLALVARFRAILRIPSY